MVVAANQTKVILNLVRTKITRRKRSVSGPFGTSTPNQLLFFVKVTRSTLFHLSQSRQLRKVFGISSRSLSTILWLKTVAKQRYFLRLTSTLSSPPRRNGIVPAKHSAVIEKLMHLDTSILTVPYPRRTWIGLKTPKINSLSK